MLTFEWPWLMLLLPLPWFYRQWRKPVETRVAALKAPLYVELIKPETTGLTATRWQQLALILLVISWVSTLLAATRPTWVGDPVALPSNGRDLLIAVDISGSMKEADMELAGQTVNRLTAVKSVVGGFVERRKGDRLGLILFGSTPYLQTPLTFDRTTMNTLLQEAQIGFAGNGTAIGDAIGLGVKRLQERPENHRVMILLTDGANTAGEIPPLEAAKIAAAKGIKVYTIGIGADVMYQRSLFGTRKINPSRDLDEKTLTSIAEQTGGLYFRARNPQELEEIYHHLDELEPVEQDAETLRPTKALFHWPLAVALVSSLLLSLLVQRGGQR